jgi:hypothetical protein
MAEIRDLVKVSSEVATAAGQLASRLAGSSLRSYTQLAKAHALSRLGVILASIAYYLRIKDSVARKISQNRIHKFLRRLEAICTVRLTAVCVSETLISYIVAEST